MDLSNLSKAEKLELALRAGQVKTSLQLSRECSTICIGTVVADLRKRWKRLGINDREIVCEQRMENGINISSYHIRELLVLTGTN